MPVLRTVKFYPGSVIQRGVDSGPSDLTMDEIPMRCRTSKRFLALARQDRFPPQSASAAQIARTSASRLSNCVFVAPADGSFPSGRCLRGNVLSALVEARSVMGQRQIEVGHVDV
jgi:hypothetical protein